MCNFESSQKHESRAQSADSSKAYRKPRAFNCFYVLLIWVDWKRQSWWDNCETILSFEFLLLESSFVQCAFVCSQKQNRGLAHCYSWQQLSKKCLVMHFWGVATFSHQTFCQYFIRTVIRVVSRFLRCEKGLPAYLLSWCHSANCACRARTNAANRKH